jgi:hypothetical protein
MSDKKSPFAFLKTPVLSALTFVLTVVTVSVGYAAWTALDRNAAATGQTVTSSLMQAVIDDVNDLNSRVSNFSFSGGNVGVGTASPQSLLHLSNTRPTMRFEDTDGRSYEFVNNGGYFAIDDKTSSINRLAIDASGNVGVGTTTPAAKLEVNGDFIRTIARAQGYGSTNDTDQ